MTIDDVETICSERLSIIKEGQGHWAECIQAIEQYGNERAAASEAIAKAAAEFESLVNFDDWADHPEIGIAFKKMQDALRGKK